MATAIVPKIYDPKLADRDIEIATEARLRRGEALGAGGRLLVGYRQARR